MPDLVPVEHDPFAVTLTPVEHDPFDPLAASAGIAPAGAPRIDQIDWGQPSWLEQAGEQSQRDQEAFARGGPREVLRNTEGTQDLAGGFSDAGAEVGIAGTFGGKLAKTADHAMLVRAQEMAKAGASREDIWNQTRWFQGADKQWRFEIPDDAAKFTVPVKDWVSRENGVLMAPNAGTAFRAAADNLVPQAPMRVKRLLNHPDLAAAYPDVPNTEMLLHRQGTSLRGSTFADKDAPLAINEALTPQDAMSTMLHELQHRVQGEEGFATGANTYGLRSNTPAWNIYQERLQAIRDSGNVSREEFSQRAGYDGLAPEKEYRDFVKSTQRISPMIDRSAQEYAVREAYRRHAGEVESRNVQTRMNMTPEQRAAAAPWTTEDVPAEQQIVRFGASGPQNKERETFALHHLSQGLRDHVARNRPQL